MVREVIRYGRVIELHKDDGLYCPLCGAKEVWIEGGPGDYYLGPDHYCGSCGAGFNLPCYSESNEVGQQMIDYVEPAKEEIKKAEDLASKQYKDFVDSASGQLAAQIEKDLFGNKVNQKKEKI